MVVGRTKFGGAIRTRVQVIKVFAVAGTPLPNCIPKVSVLAAGQSDVPQLILNFNISA